MIIRSPASRRGIPSLVLRDDVILRNQDKGPATEFAAVVLFAGMNVAIALEAR
jgi:hypothetical protein